ncbi:MAG: hypothetical protein LBT83_03870 [Tannerella sp.]|jgi:hypothetical protein|nr:hypothetical protein [Tannerella sp.]
MKIIYKYRNFLYLFIASFLLTLYAIPAAAQVKAQSETMTRMLADAKQKGLRIEKAGMQDLGAVCPGKQIRVEMADSMLLDMGVALFSETMDKRYARPVYSFIERYLLALLLKRNQTEQRYLLREDFVTLKVNGRNFLDGKQPLSLLVHAIDSASSFRLTGDSSHFRAQWSVANEDIELSFPKQYDLILGQDKKELAASFQYELESFVYRKPDIAYHPLSPHSVPVSGVYADMGDTYIIPQMQSGRFMQKKELGYDYIFNERMGTESLLNLFTYADEMSRKNKLQLTIKGYQLSREFSFGLDRLCAYMKAQQCTAYMGIETQTDTLYTGTVVYVNRDLMYMHLLYFKFPKEAFKRDEVPVYATLHPYIPINNIETLYGELDNYKKTY